MGIPRSVVLSERDESTNPSPGRPAGDATPNLETTSQPNNQPINAELIELERKERYAQTIASIADPDVNPGFESLGPISPGDTQPERIAKVLEARGYSEKLFAQKSKGSVEDFLKSNTTFTQEDYEKIPGLKDFLAKILSGDGNIDYDHNLYIVENQLEPKIIKLFGEYETYAEGQRGFEVIVGEVHDPLKTYIITVKDHGLPKATPAPASTAPATEPSSEVMPSNPGATQSPSASASPSPAPSAQAMQAEKSPVLELVPALVPVFDPQFKPAEQAKGLVYARVPVSVTEALNNPASPEGQGIIFYVRGWLQEQLNKDTSGQLAAKVKAIAASGTPEEQFNNLFKLYVDTAKPSEVIKKDGKYSVDASAIQELAMKAGYKGVFSSVEAANSYIQQSATFNQPSQPAAEPRPVDQPSVPQAQSGLAAAIMDVAGEVRDQASAPLTPDEIKAEEATKLRQARLDLVRDIISKNNGLQIQLATEGSGSFLANGLSPELGWEATLSRINREPGLESKLSEDRWPLDPRNTKLSGLVAQFLNGKISEENFINNLPLGTAQVAELLTQYAGVVAGVGTAGRYSVPRTASGSPRVAAPATVTVPR
jgi:hypothetical protein